MSVFGCNPQKVRFWHTFLFGNYGEAALLYSMCKICFFLYMIFKLLIQYSFWVISTTFLFISYLLNWPLEGSRTFWGQQTFFEIPLILPCFMWDLNHITEDLYMLNPWSLLYFQGGNNIHSRGVSAIAKTLKNNAVLTTVSHLNILIIFAYKISYKINSEYAL